VLSFRLALRAGARLRLSNVDWREGEIRIDPRNPHENESCLRPPIKIEGDSYSLRESQQEIAAHRVKK
jgi:hypothetical protein